MNLTRIALPVLLLVTVLLQSCVGRPPANAADLCDIFQEKRRWYRSAQKSEKRWGTDISIIMAFMYQESSYRARAKPPRKKILWVIPGPRPTSAYGYAQATKETWSDYQKATGRRGADRNDFSDAADFVGWYNNRSRRTNGIGKDDAYHLYLAYHEGHGGFSRRTFRNKQWLKDIAKKVSARSATYRRQLDGCEKKLGQGFLRRLFF